MPQTYRRVVVIGSGPSGLSAVRALSDENKFDTIRLFERRDRVGGIWLYDPEPDVLRAPVSKPPSTNKPPSRIPSFEAPAGEDKGARTGIYDTLDSNVGAQVMAFTHTPFPEVNSAISTQRYGADNPTRPNQIVAGYLEDGFKDYRHLLSLNTTVEKVEKVGNEWVLTLRKSGEIYRGKAQDYWWQENFDAVVVATGHYTVPNIPAIWGIDEQLKLFQTSSNTPSSSETPITMLARPSLNRKRPPLSLPTRPQPPPRRRLPPSGVVRKPPIKSISSSRGGTIEFEDGSTLENFDKVIFGTGYRLSYPFLHPHPVTPQNRLAGFYQHIFQIGDPSLTVVGQVKAAISFRVYEYQAVAVARFLAGRATLPTEEAQREWEAKRLEYKGPTNNFHEIKPDLAEYFTWLRDLAGRPAEGTNGYALPAWEDAWGVLGFKVLVLKERYWRSLKRAAEEEPELIKAKL